MTDILEVTLKGGLLLGGAAAAGLHDTTVRDADGLPFLPATALKGAIRAQLGRLVDRDRVTRILGGAGIRPTGDDGDATVERIGGGNSRVYLGDAVLVDEALKELFGSGLGYAQKTQVSIDRSSRRAADQHLFQREILAPFAEGMRFHAPIDLSRLDGDDRDVFEAAVAAVFALGAGRTAGLGGVDMAIKPGTKAPDEPLAVDPTGSVELVLEAVDPISVGVDRAQGNFHPTLGHLPASTLRGAVVTAALEQRGVVDVDQSGNPEFIQLVLHPRTCLRFGDARPGDGPSPMPAPLTLRTCKAGGTEHGVVDTLVRDFFVNWLAQRRVFTAPEERCPDCGERLVAAAHHLGWKEPRRRVVTRLGLDSATARGADGQLFSIELLERGTVFVATVSGVGPEGQRLLTDAARGVLRVGHGRSQGYGRLIITHVRPAPEDDLDARLRRFDDDVRSGLQQLAAALGEPLDDDHHYLAATLLTDLVPTDPGLLAERAVVTALGLDAKAVYSQVRTELRGGWDARRGGPKRYEPVVRAGSVLLLRVAGSLDVLREQLAEIEERGAGRVREEGYGWVRFSDPVHTSQWRSP